MFVTTWYKE